MLLPSARVWLAREAPYREGSRGRAGRIRRIFEGGFDASLVGRARTPSLRSGSL
jgi:hypothetical protein